jgi:hypothetical protein
MTAKRILPKVCMYCKKNLAFTNYEYFVVRKVLKPPHTPHRWVTLGYCCDHCHEAGKPVTIEYLPRI